MSRYQGRLARERLDWGHRGRSPELFGSEAHPLPQTPLLPSAVDITDVDDSSPPSESLAKLSARALELIKNFIYSHTVYTAGVQGDGVRCSGCD